ncbi:MAG: hypothetical protein AAF614_05590 [Chloroflexota bacterium]
MLTQAEPAVSEGGETAVLPDGANLFISRTYRNGLLNTSHQGVFGPAICTRWGDPFSPRFSEFETPKPRNADGTYSYTYRIRVPQSYREEHNQLQIELFDPDSINQDFDNEDVVLVQRTAIAQSLGIAANEELSCSPGSSRNRWNPCLIETGEYRLTQMMTPTLTIDQVNPTWFMRVDENRGTGTSAQHGDYSCTVRLSYDPYYNTATQFDLYYFQALPNRLVERVPLSQYTGQVGDGIRDTGDHLTDLRWVTPGVTLGVSVDAGNAFLLDLTHEVPNIIIDPETGDMDIYLDVTGVTGASENGFDLWAGPPVDPAVPSDVNERNLYLLNNPGTHDSAGVVIYGVRNLPQNSNIGLRDRDVQNGSAGPFGRAVEEKRPLIPFTPALAGQTITVTLYDIDAGATPPIRFTIDTIPEEEWSATFGIEPEGRCFEVGQIIDARDPYACNGQWIEPSYLIQLPDSFGACPGGCGRSTLEVTLRPGLSDSYGWDVQVPIMVPPPVYELHLPVVEKRP